MAMRRDLVPIEGGAIWSRPDLGLLMVVDPTHLGDAIPDIPDRMPPRPETIPVGGVPDGEIRWCHDIVLLDRPIRVRARVPGGVGGLSPRIAHLAQALPTAPVHCLDLTADGGAFHLWLDGARRRSVDTAPELVGETYTALLEFAVAPQRVALFLHAVGIVIDGVSLLLGAVSQGGKTTLALGLAASGAILLSDDTVALIADDLSIVGLPVALRVRAGGWPLALSALPPPAAGLPPNRQGIRHVPPAWAGETAMRAAPAAAIVALDYRPGAAPAWRRVTAAAGLAALINSGASLPGPPTPDLVATLAQWCDGSRFFHLTYGSLRDGVAAVQAIARQERS
jgi:hypothetical protein